ncbi:MAG: SGNH/GDSL hydrolase family protein [Gemmiger sp.]
MSRNDSRRGSFSPTQRRACLVLVLCVLAVVATFLLSWVLLPNLLGGKTSSGGYDPSAYPLDTSLDSVLPEATSSDSNYLGSTVFLGDSYVDSLYSTGQIQLDQYLGANGLTLGDVLQKSCINFANDSATYTIPQALAKMKPRRVVILLGSDDLSDGTTADSFLMDFRNVLKSLNTAYSYSDLIVSTLPPVAETSDNAAARQTLIDQINQQLAVACNEDGYKLLNTAEVLKDSTGYANAGYVTANGFSESGAQAMLNYVTTHAYDAEDRRPDTSDIPLRATQASAEATPGPTPTATPGKHTVTYEVEEGKGTLKTSDTSGVPTLTMEVDDRSTVSVTAVAAEGYEFYQWSDGQTNATRYDLVTKDLSVTAMFNKKTTVALTIDEGNQTMRVGESITFHSTLKVNEEDGNTDNVQWAVNGDLQRNGYSFTFTPESEGTYTIRAGIEIDGVFASNEVTVTVEQPATRVSVSGVQSIPAGQATTLTATVENASGDVSWSCPQKPDWSATGNSAQFSADTPGEYHILATNNGATAEFVLNVTAPAATPTPTSTPSGG